MPFYQFGDMFFLKRIPTEKWVPFITLRFAQTGKRISDKLAEKICVTVENYSAYVQQLAWNVLAVSGERVTNESFNDGLEATLAQVIPLFVEQTANLTTYQLNLLRAIVAGTHRDFGKKETTSVYDLGTRSNIPKIIKALTEREIIDTNENGIFIADPLFKFLKEQKGFAGWNMEHPIAGILDKMLAEADPDYQSKPDIKWNFTKFLIDKRGMVVARYEPTEKIEVIEQKIIELL